MPNIEQIIREAMERGEFDNLSGAGKPIDLSAYFDTPEDLRMAYSVLKSADILPQEAELLKEITALKEEAQGTKDADKRKRLLKAAEDKRLQFSLLMDRQKRFKES
jgi:hypothetical protein